MATKNGNGRRRAFGAGWSHFLLTHMGGFFVSGRTPTARARHAFCAARSGGERTRYKQLGAVLFTAHLRSAQGRARPISFAPQDAAHCVIKNAFAPGSGWHAAFFAGCQLLEGDLTRAFNIVRIVRRSEPLLACCSTPTMAHNPRIMLLARGSPIGGAAAARRAAQGGYQLARRPQDGCGAARASRLHVA